MNADEPGRHSRLLVFYYNSKMRISNTPSNSRVTSMENRNSNVKTTNLQ